MRGSLLTLTIVNLSWHAMEVSIQETTMAVRRGITAAALESQALRAFGRRKNNPHIKVPIFALDLAAGAPRSPICFLPVTCGTAQS